MKFYDSYQNEVDTELTELEQLFKRLYFSHPERHLDTPKRIPETEDIIQLALRQTSSPLPQPLIKSELDETIFFNSGFDTELYRHLRYFPANWHSHSFFEVACVVQGNCMNYIANQTLPMQEGDICIIAPQTTHAISAFTDDCIILNVLLRTSTFEQVFFGILAENDILSDFFMRCLYQSKQHPYLFFRTEGDQEVFNFVGYAYDEFTGNHQYKSRMLNSIINAFFITLLRNQGSSVITPEIDMHGKDENVVFILKYIQENYSSVTLKELSDFFNYSERQIQRIVKKSTGISFSENIQKLKMRQAARLLSNPNVSVTAIAEELGYSDQGNFRHIFRKYYGMTPIEYREHSHTSALIG